MEAQIAINHYELDEIMNHVEGKYISPCPFCGGHAELSHTHTVAWSIECNNCGCTLDDPNATGEDSNDIKIHRESAKRVAERWNTRFTIE